MPKLLELAKKHKVRTICLGAVVLVVLGFATQEQLDFITGFGGDTDITGFLQDKRKDDSPTVSVTKDKVTKFDIKRKVTVDGADLEIVTTIAKQEPKKLWDWLSLLGGPLAVAVFAVWVDNLLQRAATKREGLEKEIAEARLQEEAFQNYIDRMLALAVDQSFVAALNKGDGELVKTITAVVKARTESILRTVYGNGKLQIQVVRFITDIKVFSGLDFELRKPDLSNADFTGANFENVILTGANLSGANLSNASFFGAWLPQANLSGANLKGAWLTEAHLSGADLSDADLSNANLSNLNLSGACLSGANLSEACLAGANLSGANLTHADLTGAELFDTNLLNADLSNANLSYAQLKTEDNFKLFGTRFEGSTLKGMQISDKIVDTIQLSSEQQLQLTRQKTNLWVKQKRED